MNSRAKIRLKEWMLIILAWIGIMYFYNIITIWGYRSFLKDNAITEYYDSGLVHFELILQGIIFGVLFALINTATDKTEIRKKSFGAVILIKSLLYLLSFATAGVLTYLVYEAFGLMTEKMWHETLSLITPMNVLSMSIYFVTAILLMNFILQINKKFGPGNLWKMITGKYHSPRDDKKIFMFMDLQGSTTIAEKLGHNKYSQLMQNCIYDLTEILLKYKASVYQYVGDEVVLTWDMKTGLENLNCIKTYFAFEKKLKLQKDFYLKNFGTVPFFKCGIDCGEVTVAEIGELKREIAYHGDVLNTAARIEKKCTPLNRKMIVSEYLEKELPAELNGFSKELIGEIELRGRKGKLNLYSINYDE
jgi:adenylate cyclase